MLGNRPADGRKFVPDDHRMKELMLYIAKQSESDERFGATKLNKLLFYADFMSYLHFGEPITGQEYQALGEGPAPRRLVPLRDELINSDAAFLFEAEYYRKPQHRLLAKRPPDLNVFTAEQISLVRELISQCWSMNASEMSLASHGFIGWKFAIEGETIPYSVALVGNRFPTPEEVARGLELEGFAEEVLAS